MNEELIALLMRHTTGAKSPITTPIAGLTLLRSDHEKRPNHLIFKPALCIVAQGAKWAIFGNRRVDYRAGQALVVTAELPALGRVAEASPTKPYLGIVIEFDLPIMREVLDQLADSPPKVADNPKSAVLVADFTGPLADSTVRLVHLLDTPKAIPVLYPAIMREISYWLLSGPHGGHVIGMTMANTHERRVIKAIHALRDRFTSPLRIRDLAGVARMSESVFHRHFKAITALTPLQYQKRLRLLEARRLMAFENTTVESAAFEVGYESPSQFSREYSRMFGTSPRRDVAALVRAPLKGAEGSRNLNSQSR